MATSWEWLSAIKFLSFTINRLRAYTGLCMSTVILNVISCYSLQAIVFTDH